jgi:hypothetical protein
LIPFSILLFYSQSFQEVGFCFYIQGGRRNSRSETETQWAFLLNGNSYCSALCSLFAVLGEFYLASRVVPTKYLLSVAPHRALRTTFYFLFYYNSFGKEKETRGHMQVGNWELFLLVSTVVQTVYREIPNSIRLCLPSIHRWIVLCCRCPVSTGRAGACVLRM